MKTPIGMLSKEEAKKSARDAIIVGICLIVVNLTEIGQLTDLGVNQDIITGVLTTIAFFANRVINIYRV